MQKKREKTLQGIKIGNINLRRELQKQIETLAD